MSTATAARPTLKAEFSIEQRTTVRVDLVTYFNGLTALERVQYWDIDLQGCEEWERPRCYIHEHLIEATEGINIPQVAGMTDSGDDIEVDDYGRAKRDEYDALLAQVPWLDPDNKPTEEDVSRLPGPLDKPLF